VAVGYSADTVRRQRVWASYMTARTCGRLNTALSIHAMPIMIFTLWGPRFLLIGSRIAMQRSMLIMTTMYVDKYSPNTCKMTR